MLSARSFVPLTRAQARAFAGGNVSAKGEAELRPFLVRAFGAEGIRDVRWDGHSLRVTGTAMGACPDLVKLPIIVLLERPPTQVFVDTWGIL
jgi:hypothetical protein